MIMCVLFSRWKPVVPSLTLNGQYLKWENHVKHLGNVLASDLSEKQDVRMKRGDLAGRTNVMIGNLHEMSTDIILKIFSITAERKMSLPFLKKSAVVIWNLLSTY